jgi:hypothetical protein
MENKVENNTVVDYSEIQLREIFTKAGLSSQDIDKAIADYIRYRENELSSLSILSYEELQKFGAERLTSALSKVKSGEEVLNSILRGYLNYATSKKNIAKTYHESKSWDKVLSTDVYSELSESKESFIDYVEETYQTKIKDAKHLQKLTGVTKTMALSIEEGMELLEEILTEAKYSKFFRALEKALQEGAKYKDLLKIKPQDYGLPKTWIGCLGSDQYSSILWAISFEFLINEPYGLTIKPDLRSIAEEIEAPYSVLLDCYILTNRDK